MHVFLTGATGFVGSYVLRELVAAGHAARCLLRDPLVRLSVDGEGVERVEGDVTEPDSLPGPMRGCDAVVHLVGIIDEKPSKGVTFEAIHHQGARNVIDAARDAGIRRFVLISANGARADGVSEYQTTKWKAEQYLENSEFDHWTIVRPSIVFGDPGPDTIDFATRLARQLVKPFPILPVFGDGQYRMQPVSVEEVASALVQALTLESANGRRYCAAGTESFPFTEVLDRIALGLGQSPKPKIKQPLFLARPAVHAAGKLGLLPISPDQFEMLIDGNTCDSAAFYRDFELDPIPFTPERLAYLRQRV